MKKPEVTRRLLPLLDIMMLLLTFFIIMPHGIVTKEKEQIMRLNNANEDLKQQIDYYQWHFSEREQMSGNEYRTMTLVLVNNNLYLKDDMLDSKSWESWGKFPYELYDDKEKYNNETKKISQVWEEKIAYHAHVKKINFVFMQIRDRKDNQETIMDCLNTLEVLLKKYKMLYILENRN